MHPLYADLYDRLADMHNQIKEAIRGLPAEALDWDPGPDMNTLTVLITHTCGAERYWIGTIAGDMSSERVRSEEFKATGGSLDLLLQDLDRTLEISRSTLESLSVDDLTTKRSSPLHDGREFRVAWSILHALEHTSVHVGHIQIIRQLWDQQSNS